MAKKVVAGAGSSTRHFYSACAAGLGVVLKSPANISQSWAGSALPIIGGRGGALAGSVVWPNTLNPLLSFDEAWTEITGTETGPGTYTTTIQIAVTNLNILNRIAGSINVTFKFVYIDDPTDRNKDVVDVTITPAAPYSGLTIPGVVTDRISFNTSLFTGAGKDFRKLRSDIDRIRAGAKHKKHPHGEAGGHKHGVLFTALVEPERTFTYSDPDFGMFPTAVPGLGKVYFGEWWAEPYRQDFTLLRVVLEDAFAESNPNVKFRGEIVIDENENGRTGP